MLLIIMGYIKKYLKITKLKNDVFLSSNKDLIFINK